MQTNSMSLSWDGKWLVAGTILGIALLAAILSSAEAQQRGQQPGSPSGEAGQPRGQGKGGREARSQFDFTGMLARQMLMQADKDGGGKLTRAEFLALADAWFDTLDADKSGKLNQQQFSSKLGDLLPSSEQGFGVTLFLGPGMFAAADVDKDGWLTRAEFRQTFQKWFAKWDADKSGFLDETKLSAGLNKAWPQPRFGMAGAGDRLAAEVKRGADFSPKPPVQALSPEEEAKRFLLPKGYRMELVLAEPHVKEPVLAVFDGNGRLYVAEMRSYMQDVDGKDQRAPVGRISRHESTKGDGVYDRHTVFVDNLVLPRLVLPLDKSILVMETDSDDIVEYWDTDGDGVADKKKVWFHGAGRRGNLEHQQSGMVWGLDNWIYTTYNAFRLRWTPGGVLKEPTGPNGGQWGLAQDDSGKMWFVDGGGERGPVNFQQPIVYGAFSVNGEFEDDFDTVWPAPGGLGDMQGGMMRVRMPDGTLNHFTAACGQDVFRGDRLPADLRGDLLFAEPVGRLVRRAKIDVADGVTRLRNAYPKSEFVRSTDPLFRPVNMTTAPDGTLYIVDMYRGIVQETTWVEPGSYLRKKVQQYQLDKLTMRGRIWRLVHDGIEPNRQQPRMLEETPAQLVRHLGSANGWWRDTAQRLLVLRQDNSVVPGLVKMAQNAGNLLAGIHALWTLEGLGALDASLVREKLKDPDPRVRVQAMRLSESLVKAGDRSLLDDVRALTKDKDPNVVIQAMLTLNLLKAPDAATAIGSTVKSSRSRGVKEIGGQLLQPHRDQSGLGEFPPFRFTPEQRKLLERGSLIYRELCYTCHGSDGKGAPLAGAPAGTTMAPPLAGSPRVQGHRDYAVNTLLHGLIGPIDGNSYQSLMAPMGNNDDEWVAAAASYVRNSFGNSASIITPAEVSKARAAAGNRAYPWTVEEMESALPGYLRYAPDWKVSASLNSEFAEFAINSPGFVQWDTGEPQKPGAWFQIELPRPVTLGEIQLDSPSSPFGPGTFPRGYEVRVSTDGKAWTAVAEGKGNGPSTRIAVKPVPARFVRATLTASADNATWAIQRTRLFEAVREPSAAALAPRVGKMKLDEVLDTVAATKGRASRGRELFTQLSCVACHATRPDEPPKGPYLAKTIGKYKRRELAEQILLPSKIILEGYATYVFALKDGTTLEGFVVKETKEAIVIRTVAAQEHEIRVADIEERKKTDKSLMPEGLVANLTISELASLLDFLEGLAAVPPKP